MAAEDNQIERAPNNQPANRQADVVPERHQSVTITRTWQGPLPDPDSLALYEQLVPGAAERLLSVFEGQVEHRHRMESHASGRRSWGLAAAFVIVILILAAGVGLIYLGHGWVGAAIIGINIVGLAAVFITGGIRWRNGSVQSDNSDDLMYD